MREPIVRLAGSFCLVILVGSVLGRAQEEKRPSAPAGALPAVTSQDLLNGLKNPSSWLTYSGDYSGQRHSPLKQITPENAHRLSAQWTFQTDTTARGRGFEATPLIVDGVIYSTGPNGFAWALDARTGRPFWRYRRELPNNLTYGASVPVNRGFGVLADRLFMTTLDSHLVALDMKTGGVLWDIALADYKAGYSGTVPPLVVKDRLIVGSSGGDYPTRGFLDAYDPATGKRIWRFNTVPAPGEPGSETWPASAEQLARGGGTTWVVGSYDPELNTVYWGTGNPNPDYYGDDRKGDNLYTCSLIAIDPDTGQLKWYYQFTPHDLHDWDSNHVPVLADLTIAGQRHKVVMVANRNGFFYVLDRVTGKVLLGKPFTDTTWARELGPDGHPIVLNDGSKGCLPDNWGGTNFMPPSFDPALRLFFVTARETCATFVPEHQVITPGRFSLSGTVRRDLDKAYGALRAIDPTTGERRWEFKFQTPSFSGVLSTASGVVFDGDNEGNFMAFDSRTGKNLWHYQTGSPIWGGAPMTYMLDDRQYVVIGSGSSITAFALPRE
jgi:alcohol dehydrogenase (cytochrome c)